MLLTKKQEFELITAIKGRGEIPLKFQYLGEGSKNWDKIAKYRLKTGGITAIEFNLLRKKIKLFLDPYSNIKKINVIDLGCGNGIASYPVLEELQRRKIKFKYIPIDISKELLNMAVKNVKAKFGNVECKAFQLDFESGNFSDVIYELKEGDSVNLLLFLGSTLGNFSDRNRILTNFRDSMSSDDYLIIGVELTNLYKIHKILPYYRGKLTEDFLYFIPEKIGIKRKDTIFDVGWNESKKQIEARMILRKDIEVKIGSEKFILEKGEQILLGISVKFTEETLTKLLSDVGFRTELLTTSEDRGYILSMVQPTRYSI
jgi:uncharacterized SAM-dependent methyltransferase